MIHFGLEKLLFKINFNSSCYYPITFEEKEADPLLFMKFGLFGRSISISWKPSSRLERIDLFTEVNLHGMQWSHYIGSVNIDTNYILKIKLERKFGMYWVRILSDNTSSPYISISAQFKFPRAKWGFIKECNKHNNILFKRIIE